MRAGLKLVSLFLTLMLSGSGRASDKGFRFNEITGRCENAAGAPGMSPGFRGECGDLRGVDLRSANLYGLDLRGADLRGTVLDRADLAHASLLRADLRGANFSRAYLYRTDLRESDLRGAVFSLTMRGTDLDGTDLRGALVDESTIIPFDQAASQARGLVLVTRQGSARLASAR